MFKVVGLLVAGVAIGGIVGVLAILALRSDHKTPPTPLIPDRVVGVVKRCTLVAIGGRTFDLEGPDLCTGDQTSAGGAGAVYNTRFDLTVRTSAGTTYNVSVPPTKTVNVGDPWP